MASECKPRVWKLKPYVEGNGPWWYVWWPGLWIPSAHSTWGDAMRAVADWYRSRAARKIA